MVDQAKKAHDARDLTRPEQLDLLGVPTPTEMLEARRKLGPKASALELTAEARRGRPPGAKNRAGQDFRRYIMGFGQDPAITLMQIQSTPAEILMEQSRRTYTRIDRHGNPHEIVVELSYGEAQQLRKQCAAELMPFIHAKQAAVDKDGEAVAPLIIAGSTHTQQQVNDIINAGTLDVDWDEVDD
ncbi:hypothetical protein AQZ49_02535 [Novosphingobium sp. FSW06-99]|nr:hypothetical protein AQZ49_02535 [Novosphingobium sp. FSW06-99]